MGTTSLKGLAWSQTDIVDYGETCFMHIIPGVVLKFPKAEDRISVFYAQKDSGFL